jgi:hypothetical protein
LLLIGRTLKIGDNRMKIIKRIHQHKSLWLSICFLLAVIILFPEPVSAGSPYVKLKILSIKKVDKRGFVVKGTVLADGLNPEGQIVETDAVTIFADIKMDSNSTYQVLPESMYIRQPAKCESPYTKNRKCLTLKEERGVGISRGVAARLGNIRKSPVWSAYGGLGTWRKNAHESVTLLFEGVIPFSRHYKGRLIQTEGKQVRIRATLQHTWGGPYAAWSAFSFHHDVGFDGELQQYVNCVRSSKPVDIPSDIGKNWKMCQHDRYAIYMVVQYIKKRAILYSSINKNISKLLNLYVQYISDAEISYKSTPTYFKFFKGKSGQIASCWLGKINIYNGFYCHDFFSNNSYHSVGCYSSDELSSAASAIMHEVAHAKGANERQAHLLQKITFDALGVNAKSEARRAVSNYFKVFSWPYDPRAQYLYWLWL